MLLCVLLARVEARAADPRRWLEERITKLSADARIAPARVGVLVQDVASGRTLVKLRETEQFNVASCAKLVTTAAALWALGPEYRFKTLLYADPQRDERTSKRKKNRPAGTLEGNLYLKGFGSPVLDERDLWQLVDDLKDRGIRAIGGALVIDESYFDGQRLAPLYETRNTDAWYRPPNGALSIAYNVVSVHVFAGDAPGQPARIVLRPRSSYLKLVNKVATVSRGRRSWVQVRTRARGGRAEVEVTGRVRLGYKRRRPFRRRIDDPGLLAGHALLDILARRAVAVGQRRVLRGKVPDKAQALAWHYSEPLAVVARLMNKHSNNFIAEQVAKTLGAEVIGPPATWGKGLKVVGRHLKSLSITSGSYTMKNGSGLYDASAFSPAQLVQILRGSYLAFRTGADYVASLAQAGVDGTLQHRYVGSGAERYVRAKTGTLARVVTLAGYAGAAVNRGPLVFAILLNDLPEGRVRQAREVADEMAAAMVTFLER